MEDRIYSRVNVSFPVRISPDITGSTVDISETGLGMVFDKPILLTKANVKIELEPDQAVESEFKVIWNKQLVEKGGIRYGACFVRLKEKDIDMLRRLAIRQYSKSVLDRIDALQTRDIVSKFYIDDFFKYMKQFEAIELGLKKNINSVDDSYEMLKNITDKLLLRGDQIELLIDKKIIIKKIKESFRILCGPLAYKGKIVRRAFEKPRGYPGDYLTIEYVYDNKSISNEMGICCDRYFLDNKYAIAVRNRKDKMREILLKYLSVKKSDAINILNIACGSCREIKELFTIHGNKIDRSVFSLVDQDEEALFFSKESLLNHKPSTVKLDFLQHDITNYIKEGKKYSSILGKQDFIYSIGLADYLPDSILKKLLFFLFSQLKDKGTLVFAHKDILMYKPIATDWWCNWTFYSRDEKKVLDLISSCGIDNVDIKLEREQSGLIIFFIISRK